jgi:hypothetical protein
MSVIYGRYDYSVNIAVLLIFRNIEYSDSIHRPGIKQQRETRRFGNWTCFRPQVREKKTILLGPLESASPNHWSESYSNYLSC